ncbi:hypothetical protein EV192_109125 [Actinocrispum wychmicini]|uniref:Uncharacterized protein n=1 Tax=Actinocrispum wychmicini TaxID=1213861 RepID=A0A4R2JJ22_9PSEU|nr:hypothetical protein EV192_109125 [Actinocrispum wychmicini]
MTKRDRLQLPRQAADAARAGGEAPKRPDLNHLPADINRLVPSVFPERSYLRLARDVLGSWSWTLRLCLILFVVGAVLYLVPVNQLAALVDALLHRKT